MKPARLGAISPSNMGNQMRLHILAAALLLTGCGTTTTIKRAAAPPAGISEACIERNAEVRVDDLLPAIEGAFQRAGIATKVFDVSPAPCLYRVTYSASRRWDLVMFMSDANVSLFRERELIGEATFALPAGIFGSGGIDPNKFRGAAYKMDPLMDAMLAGLKK